MKRDFRALLLLVVVFCLLLPALAQAAITPLPNPSGYWDDPSTPEVESYGYNPTPTTGPPTGSHGGFAATTNRCRDCHAVHQAQSSNKLLRYQTISDNCLYCHDATAGPSVGVPIRIMPWGSIQASHYVSTVTIVGGDYNLAFPLTCTNCHSPHGSPPRILPPEEYFYCDNTSTASSHLLLKNPNPNNTATIPGFYGGYWCSDCHNRRMSSGPLHNHPVSDTLRYTSASLPRNSQQYYRMAPVEPVVDRVVPICQHCHEDKRDCEAAFTHTFPTGGNPFYNTFPHESDVKYFNVETGDDLCLNCHLVDELP